MKTNEVKNIKLEKNEYVIHLSEFVNESYMDEYCEEIRSVLGQDGHIKEIGKDINPMNLHIEKPYVVFAYDALRRDEIYRIMRIVYKLCNAPESHVLGFECGWADEQYRYMSLKTLNRVKYENEGDVLVDRIMKCQVIFQFYGMLEEAKTEYHMIAHEILPMNLFEFMERALKDMICDEVDGETETERESNCADKVKDFMEQIMNVMADNLMYDVYEIKRSEWRRGGKMSQKYAIYELMSSLNNGKIEPGTQGEWYNVTFEKDFSIPDAVYGNTLDNAGGKAERLYDQYCKCDVYYWAFVSDDRLHVLFAPKMSRAVPGNMHFSCIHFSSDYKGIEKAVAKLDKLVGEDQVRELIGRCVHESVISYLTGIRIVGNLYKK